MRIGEFFRAGHSTNSGRVLEKTRKNGFGGPDLFDGLAAAHLDAEAAFIGSARAPAA